jgi:hypothetical protein
MAMIAVEFGNLQYMSAADPSLDERIWAYVRGEGSHTDRKKLEAEVASDPTSARRYATIKLMQQRQEALTPAGNAAEALPQSPAKAKPGKEAWPRRSSKISTAPPANPIAALPPMAIGAILGPAFLLFLFGGGCFAMRANWESDELHSIRDGIHFAAAALTATLAIFVGNGRLWAIAIAVACIAMSCVAAAMLIR